MTTKPTNNPYPAIIQVRNGSTRFPGKALLPVLGRPMLSYLVERVRAVPSIGDICIATTTHVEDDTLADYARANGLRLFRGDAHNVLDRVYRAAMVLGGRHFVKFWGDSPLIDPALCQHVISQFETRFEGYDFVSNNHPSTYPEGMQLEVIKLAALRKAWAAPDLTDADREHVTPYIWRRPGHFSVGNVEHVPDIHDEYRICLDYPEDYPQLRSIIEALYPVNPLFGMADIMTFLARHPEVKRINAAHYESEAAYNQRVGL